MHRAHKFGVASIVCLLLAAAPPYENWKQPINALLIVICATLAWKASQLKPAWYAMIAALLMALAAAAYFAMKSL